MTADELHLALNSGRLSKLQITGLVAILEQAPDLVGDLLKEIKAQDKEDTFNASWTFDHLMRKKLVYLLPFMDDFSQVLPELKDQSSIRPMAHACQMLCETYFKHKDPIFVKNISQNHLEAIMTCCFDWFIGEHKVAAKVFSMSSLFYLGGKFDWVHPELKMILEATISEGTSGYKNRAKKTLDKLAKLGH